jgi:hypothetical protein
VQLDIALPKFGSSSANSGSRSRKVTSFRLVKRAGYEWSVARKIGASNVGFFGVARLRMERMLIIPLLKPFVGRGVQRTDGQKRG